MLCCRFGFSAWFRCPLQALTVGSLSLRCGFIILWSSFGLIFDEFHNVFF